MCFNPETTGDSLGGGNSKGLKSASVQIDLKFSQTLEDVRDEWSGAALGRGQAFKIGWKQMKVWCFPLPPLHELFWISWLRTC